MIAIGIDPGTTNGAAVAIEDGKVRRLVAWSVVKRAHGKVVRVLTLNERGAMESSESMPDAWWGSHSRMDRPDASYVLEWVVGYSARLVAVESVRSFGGGRGDQLPTADNAGRIAGWVEMFATTCAMRPSVHEWRGAIFGLPRAAKAADAAIARMLPALVTLPDGLPGWALTHVRDACGLAVYAGRHAGGAS